jgi:hypothetical protein
MKTQTQLVFSKRPAIGGRAILLFLFPAVLTASQATETSAQVRAVVDFGQALQAWDGFGVNYVETAQTRDYRASPQGYGGFSLMTEDQRRDVLEKIFGNDGLKPGIVKMFLDPFHEGATKAGNDNDDPRVINLAGFDHATTTKWMRYFAKQGLARTRRRGDDLQIVVTIYGPAPWMTKQEFVRGRDLDPAEKYECAEYLISWAKYLRDVEGLPVKYVSLHNEGEDARRWPADGSDGGPLKHDHNMYWPTGQVVDFLRFLRGMLDEQGMQDVGITPGETSNWERFYSWNYASAIADDPLAVQNLGLITSHGFGAGPLPAWSKGVDLLRSKRPQLHAWTTSMSWSKMDARFIDSIRVQIYSVKVNAVIPWAAIQRIGDWVGGDPNPGTAFNVDDQGRVYIRPGYYFYKQVSRAGQPGTAVASVKSSDEDVTLLAFSSNGTKHPDAFVVVNAGQPKTVSVQVYGSGTNRFAAFRTVERQQDGYTAIGEFNLTNGAMEYQSPGGSVTTFFGVSLEKRREIVKLYVVAFVTKVRTAEIPKVAASRTIAQVHLGIGHALRAQIEPTVVGHSD